VFPEKDQAIRYAKGPRGSPIPVPQTQSAFHPLAQRSAFCRRGARQQRRLSVRWNPRLRRSPTPTGFAEIVSDDFPVFHLTSSVAPFRRTAWLSFTVFLALTRRRFFRSADRRGAGPRRGTVLRHHSSASPMRREHAVQFPVAVRQAPSRWPTLL
jgi:hypothetical protein